MHITGFVVCVGYADLLRYTLPAWQRILTRTVVVSDLQGDDTERLVERTGAEWCYTSEFTRGGAAFNKGAALNAAVHVIRGPHDWTLLFDADVLPPADWTFSNRDGVPGTLYGAHRVQAGTGERLTVTADEFPGFFQLFHSQDPRFLEGGIPTHWPHAGNYDTEFQARWPADKKVRLPLDLLHIGQPRTFWHGREDTPAAMSKMNRMDALRRQHGGWQHERIGGVQ